MPEATFAVHGRVDLARYPAFAATGTVRVFVDRNEVAVPAVLAADGTFHTGPITLDDNQPWYSDRHYVAVNLHDGINVNTVLHHVAVGRSG